MNYVLISLALSACMGLWAILFTGNMNRDRRSGRIVIGLTFCFTALVFTTLTIFTALQYLLLTGFTIYLMIRKPETVHAARWVAALSLIPYLLLVPLWVVQSIRHQTYVRELFPLISLVEQVGKPPIALANDTLDSEGAEGLAALENLLDREILRYSSTEEFLKRVHEATVQEFIESEGFGQGRRYRISERTIAWRVKERDGPCPQEGPSFAMNSVDLAKLRKPLETERGSFNYLHAKSVIDFSFPTGFGYFQDRDHVAGFQSHRFGDWPVELSRQMISHVDLVSLLIHDQPVVYQSDEFPRMDHVQSTPTRPLNSFESASLERIKKGEDLIVADVPEGRLMMGSIRNAQQCVKCHGGKRGDLLGAFAYSIRKAETKR